ncbi:hypothetical protein Poli38472_003258 [Pythium oligandrum]|uniref:BTB domain-containing protein n=1 Tax=Pythium oligandrum TaxID=41045 RepID=A0A8K1C6I2_PYTOL|nr:hypothetical protein Poli38472_003258 [Pythium oligandrum]|eukprot:TMW57333.1 hypothetical protein Poli38472_003258 [Pythium oligandrum]
MPPRADRSRRRVSIQEATHDVEMDDDMTEREDDEQTDQSSIGLSSESPRNQTMPHSPPLAGPSAQWSPADSVTLATEDDDYRSETSSSETYSRDSSGTLTPKNVQSSYSNHRDLSTRLKHAIAGDKWTGPMFDESMIGTDVVLCVRSQQLDDDAGAVVQRRPGEGHAVEEKCFYAHRFMLAASSVPFKVMLTGHMREAVERKVEIYGMEPNIFEKVLVFIYTGEVTVDLQNVIGLLIASELYELAGLREICKSFVLYHAQEVFRDPEMVQIPEKVLIEIVEHDDLQIREVTLMEALVIWGESRVARADRPVLDILSDVMENVRFLTMSVSDLYGKVRPLVDDGVIRESLLTEALFYHLKWGTTAQGAKASQRRRPRAGTAALRKRKRVSFIQHVSFVTE